jgi:hypothetical protein
MCRAIAGGALGFVAEAPVNDADIRKTIARILGLDSRPRAA